MFCCPPRGRRPKRRFFVQLAASSQLLWRTICIQPQSSVYVPWTLSARREFNRQSRAQQFISSCNNCSRYSFCFVAFVTSNRMHCLRKFLASYCCEWSYKVEMPTTTTTARWFLQNIDPDLELATKRQPRIEPIVCRHETTYQTWLENSFVCQETCESCSLLGNAHLTCNYRKFRKMCAYAYAN